MPKVKVKRKSTFIDMTAMSDVTVLLLTFFMLTSTFIKKEPVQVITPNSVSEIKIPETNVLTILVEPTGKIFLSLDNQNDKVNTLRRVGEDYNITFDNSELNKFKQLNSFGVAITGMKGYLDLPAEKQDAVLKTLGVPNDSIDNQFQRWVKHAKEENPKLEIAIKADKSTPYPIIKKVVDDLRDMRENRYKLVTSLKVGPSAESESKH